MKNDLNRPACLIYTDFYKDYDNLADLALRVESNTESLFSYYKEASYFFNKTFDYHDATALNYCRRNLLPLPFSTKSDGSRVSALKAFNYNVKKLSRYVIKMTDVAEYDIDIQDLILNNFYDVYLHFHNSDPNKVRRFLVNIEENIINEDHIDLYFDPMDKYTEQLKAITPYLLGIIRNNKDVDLIASIFSYGNNGAERADMMPYYGNYINIYIDLVNDLYSNNNRLEDSYTVIRLCKIFGQEWTAEAGARAIAASIGDPTVISWIKNFVVENICTLIERGFVNNKDILKLSKIIGKNEEITHDLMQFFYTKVIEEPATFKITKESMYYYIDKKIDIINDVQAGIYG